jgi:hypothetical protein
LLPLRADTYKNDSYIPCKKLNNVNWYKKTATFNLSKLSATLPNFSVIQSTLTSSWCCLLRILQRKNKSTNNVHEFAVDLIKSIPPAWGELANLFNKSTTHFHIPFG